MNINLEKIKSRKTIKELLEFSIINLDKPTGPTSFSTSSFVRKSLGLKKTAHFGTLDPSVTGVLPIALNRACRLNEYFMHRNKTYVGIMRLHKEVGEKELRETIKNYIGKIKQLPPKKSRVKRQIREREITSFKLIEVENKDVLFETEVQAGTYIRKLCDDIGKNIGGAHMLELRRIKASMFEESKSVNLYQFEEALEEYKKGNDKKLRKILIPGEVVSQVLPVIQIKKEFEEKALVGSPLFSNFVQNTLQLNKGDKVCVFSGDKFIGCYNIILEGDLIAKPEFVKN